ncbi:hypothetical protein HG530_012685 [Fusarium avenaceum]|nr:hypothetical protein HG530_012685 [Fusarium avenaceum]
MLFENKSIFEGLTILFGIRVPESELLVLALVELTRGDLETDSLVGFGCDKETSSWVDGALTAFLLLASSATGEVGLMLLTLSMSKVGTVVLVNSQAQTTLERANVVLEEVGVLVEIDRLEGKLAKTFATVGVCGGLGGDAAAAEF